MQHCLFLLIIIKFYIRAVYFSVLQFVYYYVFIIIIIIIHVFMELLRIDDGLYTKLLYSCKSVN
jgi:hypothetical protein